MNYEMLDWDAPAGRLLKKLAKALPKTPALEILVFGSAPLQLLIDSNFLSKGCDIVGDDALAKIASTLTEPLESGDLYFQVCDPLMFRTAMGWQSRAIRASQHGHIFVLPHPWDILVSKIGRLEEKDLEAFRLVLARSGHPTPEELQQHLQLAVDLFRPNFDEETGSDYTTQTKILWQELYQLSIDVRSAIIAPALARRTAQYQLEDGDSQLKDRLREL